MNVFDSIKETNRSRREINRLLSKGISNVYFVLRRPQNFDFRCLKNLSLDRFLGNPNSRTYHLVLKLLVAT